VFLLPQNGWTLPGSAEELTALPQTCKLDLKLERKESGKKGLEDSMESLPLVLSNCLFGSNMFDC